MKTKLIILILLCFVSTSQAQLRNFLTALTTVDSGATILGNPTASANPKSVFFHLATVVDSIMSSLQQYGKQDGNYASLAAAVTAAASDTSSLIINRRHAITTDDTLDGMADIIVRRGGYFNIGSGDTLTFNVPFYAGLYQIFEGSGVVQFMEGSAPIIEVEWFGSGQAGVNRAIQSLPVGGGNVRFSKAITITDSILIDKARTHFYGSRNSTNTGGIFPSTVINVGSGSFDALVVSGGDNCLIEGFTISGSLATKNGNDGIRLESASIIRNVTVMHMGGNGIRMGQDSNNMNGWVLENVNSFGNDSSGVYLHDSGVAADVNAGAAFFLYTKGNGLDGLRIDNAASNQFFMYRGDTNTGYGVRLMGNSSDNSFFFPYMEGNTAGTGRIDSSANQNFIFGTRGGTSDSWAKNDTVTNDNVIMGRDNTHNDMYFWKGNIAFRDFHITSSDISSFWRFKQDSLNRNLLIELQAASSSAEMVIQSSGSGEADLTVINNLRVGTNATGSTNDSLTIRSSLGGVSAGLVINNPSATVASRGTRISFDNAGTTVAEIRSLGDGAATDGALNFHTVLSGTNNQRMRIDKNGDLSLGLSTTGGDRLVVVDNDTMAYGGFQTATYVSSRNQDAFWFDPGGDTLFVKNNGTVRFILSTAYSGSGH